MSSVNIYSPGGMCPMTLFLARSESSSVFGISAFILNYFQRALDAQYGRTFRAYMQLLNSFVSERKECISCAEKGLFLHAYRAAEMTQSATFCRSVSPERCCVLCFLGDGVVT